MSPMHSLFHSMHVLSISCDKKMGVGMKPIKMFMHFMTPRANGCIGLSISFRSRKVAGVMQRLSKAITINRMIMNMMNLVLHSREQTPPVAVLVTFCAMVGSANMQEQSVNDYINRK